MPSSPRKRVRGYRRWGEERREEVRGGELKRGEEMRENGTTSSILYSIRDTV